MPTGDEFVNPALKRFLSQNRIANELIDYLQENSFDIQARIFPSQGLFTYPATITYGAGVFSLSVAPAGPIEGTDGEGHTISLATTRQSNIPFEDDGASTYWIGMKYIEIPNGLYDNPRTGKPEYDKIMEEVGELASPSNVTSTGGGTTITMRVNNLFPAGEDNSGRVVRVWLVNPQSGDPAVAFEDCTVSWTGTDNEITTTGLLGQGTISTNGADYQVACLGVSVAIGVTNPFSSEYVMLGNIDSSQVAPAGVDTSAQIDFSGGGGHTLQKAYDGVGSGAGRIVAPNYQAIEVIQQNNAIFDKDIIQAAIRLVKDSDTSIISGPPIGPDFEVGIDLKARLHSIGMVVDRTVIVDLTGNSYVLPEETANIIAPDRLSLTRVGVNLTMPGGVGKIMDYYDFAEVEGSTQPGANGVYRLSSHTATTADLVKFDGTVPTLANESGNPNLKVTFYRPTQIIGGVGGGREVIANSDHVEDWIGGTPSFGTVDSVIISPLVSDPVPIYKQVRLDSPNKVFEILANSDVNMQYGTLDANVLKGVDILAGLNGFSYQNDKSFWKVVHPWEGNPEGSNWQRNGGGTVTIDHFENAGVSEALSFDIKIPNGARLRRVQVLISHASGTSFLYVDKIEHDWSTPAVGSVANQGSDTNASAGVRVLDVNAGATPYVVDTDQGYFRAVVYPSTVTTYVYGLRYEIYFDVSAGDKFTP